jgi:uncharacterized protein YecE (DUF72 family)
MRPVSRNLLAILLQLPPSTFAEEGVKQLKTLIPMLNPDFRYAIKVRNTSCSDKSAYRLLSDNNICLEWSQLDPIQTPPELTSDFLYLLVTSDRSIDEKLWYSAKSSAVRAESGQRRSIDLWRRVASLQS